MYSKKLVVQLLGELLYNYGIENIVISPGSRNAPLIIHFTNHKKYKCYSIVDERSAAFFAMGMAQNLQKPTAICCTSGTASANYYSAIIEAFYQNIPLLVITADRPENYVDIFDGQTIRQKEIYKNHIYGSFQLSENENDESITQNFLTIKKAIQTCINKSGPVHINIPFTEPLYEQTKKIEINIDKLQLPERNFDSNKWKSIISKWNLFNKKLILVGMQNFDYELNECVKALSNREDTIVLTEVTSNVCCNNFISNIDRLIFSFSDDDIEKYKPELIITIGQNIVSKKIKSFLRNSKVKEHWHIDEFWHPDTFFSLTEKIEEKSIIFLKELIKLPNKDSNYALLWKKLKEEKEIKHNKILEKVEFSDLKVIEVLNREIPENWNIQISNSSMIRYAQLFNLGKNHNIFCNRGASGIDGATSTAIGFSIHAEKPTVLITGDMGFFYDINALWNNYIPDNFRIILMNNGGGDIFNIIPGPTSSSSSDKYFVTKHNRTAKNIAKEYNFEYILISDLENLNENIDAFFESSNKPKILEVNTQNINNSKVLKNYFKSLI